MKDRIRQVANLTVIPLGITVTSLVAERRHIGSVARATESVLAASSWAFAIWGVIFLGQLAYAIYQATPSQALRELHRRIGALTAVNAVLGAAWMVAFTRDRFTLAWVVMVALAVTLFVMDRRIRASDPRGWDFWLVRFPYALNLGWICVAFVLNTAQFLHVKVGYDGAPLSPLAFAHVLVGVAAVLGVVLAVRRENPVAGLAVAWGLVGVATYEHDHQSLGRMAETLAVGVAVLALTRAFTRASRRAGHEVEI